MRYDRLHPTGPSILTLQFGGFTATKHLSLSDGDARFSDQGNRREALRAAPARRQARGASGGKQVLYAHTQTGFRNLDSFSTEKIRENASSENEDLAHLDRVQVQSICSRMHHV